MEVGRHSAAWRAGKSPIVFIWYFLLLKSQGLMGFFFFPTERNTETYSILMKGNKQHWLHFQSLENKFRDFASIHACDAEAASCKPEQLWSFTGRATAPPAGSSVHNCLILFFLFIKGEAIKVSRHFLEKQTWLWLLLLRNSAMTLLLKTEFISLILTLFSFLKNSNIKNGPPDPP